MDKREVPIPPHYEFMMAQYRSGKNPIVISLVQKGQIEDWAKENNIPDVAKFHGIPVAVR